MTKKNQFATAVLVTGMVVFGAAVILRLPSKPAATTAPEEADKTSLDAQIRTLEAKLAKQPNEPDLHTQLGMVYMRKAREVGHPEYYLKGETEVRRSLALAPGNYGAVKAMSWVLAGQHRFNEAVPYAKQAIEARPKDPFNFGTLGDAYTEMGNYDGAADAYQQMVNLKPNVNSYSRAAHVRELMGDRAGAIEIMQLAVRSTAPRDKENTAWAQVQLGHLHFHGGDLPAAEKQYQAALTLLPDYYMATAALARVRAAQNRFGDAIGLMEKTVFLTPLPEYKMELGDLYAHESRNAEAEKMYAAFEKGCMEGGAQFNHELAIFYADHNRHIDKALDMMKADLAVNHDIAAYDTFAWAAYKAGQNADADHAIQQALRLGTQDAKIMYHAAMILRAEGQTDRAQSLLQAALKTNPYFDYREKVTS